mmetsp:Transcript_23252/g.48267  ORF Transcript_23252/g.48267 Transcript_23252/m.48267 type:complete len:447 (-) Transcript_23252:876-2216(-)
MYPRLLKTDIDLHSPLYSQEVFVMFSPQRLHPGLVAHLELLDLVPTHLDLALEARPHGVQGRYGVGRVHLVRVLILRDPRQLLLSRSYNLLNVVVHLFHVVLERLQRALAAALPLLHVPNHVQILPDFVAPPGLLVPDSFELSLRLRFEAPLLVLELLLALELKLGRDALDPADLPLDLPVPLLPHLLPLRRDVVEALLLHLVPYLALPVLFGDVRVRLDGGDGRGELALRRVLLLDPPAAHLVEPLRLRGPHVLQLVRVGLGQSLELLGLPHPLRICLLAEPLPELREVLGMVLMHLGQPVVAGHAHRSEDGIVLFHSLLLVLDGLGVHLLVVGDEEVPLLELELVVKLQAVLLVLLYNPLNLRLQALDCDFAYLLGLPVDPLLPPYGLPLPPACSRLVDLRPSLLPDLLSRRRCPVLHELDLALQPLEARGELLLPRGHLVADG